MSVNIVAELRDKLGLRQEDISDALGLYDSYTVSRWETGLRKPNEAIRRLLCLLNDLPKKEAEEINKKLGQYRLKKR